MAAPLLLDWSRTDDGLVVADLGCANDPVRAAALRIGDFVSADDGVTGALCIVVRRDDTRVWLRPFDNARWSI